METRFIPSWAELEQFNKVKKLNKFTGDTSESVSSALVLKFIRNAYSHGVKVPFPKDWLKGGEIPKQVYVAWYNEYGNRSKSQHLKEQRGIEFLSLMIEPGLDPSARILLSGEEEDD